MNPKQSMNAAGHAATAAQEAATAAAQDAAIAAAGAAEQLKNSIKEKVKEVLPGGGSSSSSSAKADLKEAVKDYKESTRDYTDSVKETVESVKGYFNKDAAKENAKDTIKDAKDTVKGTTDSIKDTVKGYFHKDTKDTVQDKTDSIKDTVKGYFHKDTKDTGKDKTDSIKDTVKGYFHKDTKDTVQDKTDSIKDTVKGYFHKDTKDTVKDKTDSLKDTVKGYFHKDTKDTVKDKTGSLKDTIKGYFHKDTVEDYIPSHAKGLHMSDKSNTMFPALSMPYMAVLVALFVVLLTLFFLMRRKSLGSLSAFKKLVPARKHTVLICGPVDSGKTVLFHTLSGGKYQPTRTSMEENVGTFKITPELLENRKKELCNIQFEFIDFPGHPSQELKLGKFINNIQGVILLTDASSNDSIVSAAKMLFALLEKKGFMKKQVPILICANKSDLSDAQAMTAIRSRILDELNALRENRTTMDTIERVDERIEPVGKSGEKLTWENLGCTVSFGQISAKEGNVTDVLDFLETTQCCC